MARQSSAKAPTAVRIRLRPLTIKTIKIYVLMVFLLPNLRDAMTVIPYKKLQFQTDLTEDEIEDRLRSHEEFSKTKNFFTATSDEFRIKTINKGQDILIIKRDGGRTPLPTKIVMTLSRDRGTVITIRITPRIIGLVWLSPIVMLAIFIPSPIILKTFMIGIIYLFGMFGFWIDVWWTRALFERKLLRMNHNK